MSNKTGNGPRLRGRAATAVRPHRPDPIVRVTALIRLGRHEDAVRAVEEFLLTDPSHLSALELLAKSLWQIGDMTRVVEATKKLILLNPYEPGYHVLQASALQCLGRYGEAARAYSRAGDAPGVREAVEELNCWQASLVADLLATDPIFKAHYSQSPADACTARGFSFLSEGTDSERWIPGSDRRGSLFTRPS